MAKIKSNKKGRRSGRNKSRGKYEIQRRRTTASKHRRAIKREKQLAFFKANPEVGSPSQLIARGIARTCDIMLGRRAWTIDPDALAESLARELEKVGAVITGRPTVQIIKKAIPLNPDTIRDANWTV